WLQADICSMLVPLDRVGQLLEHFGKMMVATRDVGGLYMARVFHGCHRDVAGLCGAAGCDFIFPNQCDCPQIQRQMNYLRINRLQGDGLSGTTPWATRSNCETETRCWSW